MGKIAAARLGMTQIHESPIKEVVENKS